MLLGRMASVGVRQRLDNVSGILAKGRHAIRVPLGTLPGNSLGNRGAQVVEPIFRMDVGQWRRALINKVFRLEPDCSCHLFDRRLLR